MPVIVKNSSVIALNGIYYQHVVHNPRFQSDNGEYEIFLTTNHDKEKIWIFAKTNHIKSCYYIHYYECEFNETYHQMLNFIQYPPCIGWQNIAAPDDTITIYHHKYITNNDNNIKNNNDIKICIYAKRIIIKPKYIINDGYLLINQDNRICKFGKRIEKPKLDIHNIQTFHTDILCPGFIDIHIHGLGGNHNVLWYWMNPQYTCSRLPQYGCTSFCASVVFANKYLNKTVSMVQNILGPIIGKDVGYGSIIEGIHSEGPIIADIGGLPDSTDCNKWNINKFKDFVDSLMPFVNIMTISPSIDSKLKMERIKFLKSRGIVPALGHDKQCNEQQIIDTLLLDDDKDDNDSPYSIKNHKYGSCHMTHLFNVMKFHHRDVGLANFGLTPVLPNLDKYKNIIKKQLMPTIEIIGDLVHVNPLVIQTVLQCHKPDYYDRIVFITDGIAEPVPNKEYTYTDKNVKVDKNGRFLVTCDGGILCGSCSDLFTTFKSLINVFNVDIDDAIGFISYNPARVSKILDRVGSLEIGKRADCLLMSDDLILNTTIINGTVRYSR